MGAVGHVLAEMFGWPAGILTGNLIASALWAAPALVHLHRTLDRHHAEHLAALAEANPKQTVSTLLRELAGP